MKTINITSKVVFTLLLGLALMFTNSIANGQGRTRSDRKPQDREYTRTGTRSDRDRGNNQNHRYQQGVKKHGGNDYQRNNNHHGNQNHHNTGYKKHNKHQKHHNSSVTVYWNIPKYYYRSQWDYDVYHRKPWRSGYHPVVLHHRNGTAYYYNDRFYRYDNVYGYVAIDQPSHLIFTTVPAEFNSVRIRGNIYFRHGDIWMERTPRGYRLWRG